MFRRPFRSQFLLHYGIVAERTDASVPPRLSTFSPDHGKPVFIGCQWRPHQSYHCPGLDFGRRLAILKRKRMPNNRVWYAALMGLILTAVIATAQVQTNQIPVQPPAKHHHKVLGTLLFVGGVGLVALGAIALSRPCPAADRAQQISLQTGSLAGAGSCGSSWFQKDKTAIGASAVGSGAVLVVAGIAVMRKSEKAQTSMPSPAPPAAVIK